MSNVVKIDGKEYIEIDGKTYTLKNKYYRDSDCKYSHIFHTILEDFTKTHTPDDYVFRDKKISYETCNKDDKEAFTGDLLLIGYIEEPASLCTVTKLVWLFDSPNKKFMIGISNTVDIFNLYECRQVLHFSNPKFYSKLVIEIFNKLMSHQEYHSSELPKCNDTEKELMELLPPEPNEYKLLLQLSGDDSSREIEQISVHRVDGSIFNYDNNNSYMMASLLSDLEKCEFAMINTGYNKIIVNTSEIKRICYIKS